MGNLRWFIVLVNTLDCFLQFKLSFNFKLHLATHYVRVSSHNLSFSDLMEGTGSTRERKGPFPTLGLSAVIYIGEEMKLIGKEVRAST